MIPIRNTIFSGKAIKVFALDLRYTRDDGADGIHSHLFEPPLEVGLEDTINITWNINVRE
jgi:hypothetical protein